MYIAQRILLLLGLYVVFAIIESSFPAERGQPLRERLRNMGIALLFLAFGGLATAGIFYFFRPWGATSETHSFAYSFLFILASIFAADLIFYWYHRAQHAFGWLWQMHELHHSEAHMNATTSLRTFWVENPVQSLLIGLPISFIIGNDLLAVLFVPVITDFWLVFTHSNWRLRLGRLTPVICGPQLHRIHHSLLIEHRDKNFAQYFPIIDIMFGTYHAPGSDEFPPTGTPDLPTRVPFASVVARPFWKWSGRS